MRESSAAQSVSTARWLAWLHNEGHDWAAVWERKVTAVAVRQYPRAAFRVSRSGGQLKENKDLWIWKLRRDVFRTLLATECQMGLPTSNQGWKSKQVAKKSVKQTQTRQIQNLPPRNWRIYRGRWLRRWKEMQCKAIGAKRFCTAKIFITENSYIFCWCFPRNGAWYL